MPALLPSAARPRQGLLREGDTAGSVWGVKRKGVAGYNEGEDFIASLRLNSRPHSVLVAPAVGGHSLWGERSAAWERHAVVFKCDWYRCRPHSITPTPRWERRGWSCAVCLIHRIVKLPHPLLFIFIPSLTSCWMNPLPVHQSSVSLYKSRLCFQAPHISW